MNQQPFFSIIIPVLNVQQHIATCLESLLLQDYPKDKYEIIVMDNGSTDNTVEIAQKFPVKLFVKKNCNISALRNAGAQHARGEVFAFLDGDCIAPKDWLSRSCLLLRSDNVAAVGCRYALPDSTTLIERTWDILNSVRREKEGPTDWVPSSNLIIRKEVFEQIQGFDEYLITSEDVDICQRIVKTDRTIFSDPKIAVKHLGNPKTLKQFFLKEYWRGTGVIQNSFRNFPRIELNKALIFGFISLFFAIGILTGIYWWMAAGNQSLFIVSISGLLIIPLLMTVKVLLQRPQWDKFPILFLLFIVYGLGRASSLFSHKIWKDLFKE